MGTRNPDLVLPRRLGRYEVLGMLGRGGQAVVLLARDEQLGRQVAIKLVHSRHARGAQALAGEAAIVSRLQHPNIVTLYDLGGYAGLPYLVFEYIDGESLAERIARAGPLPSADAVILMSQILAGVAYLHENDVLHRDLSPANILITRDGQPKVADFGLSILRHVVVPEEELMGTLRYLSPEPLLRRTYGPCSDVFTLASIFYEMLTGRRLFEGATPEAVIAEIVSGEPIDAAARGLEVDPKVARVLEAASRRPVAERYPNARAMKSDLDAYRIPRRADAGPEAAGHSTVDFLMRRMAFKPGFSSLSQYVTELLAIMSDDSVASADRIVNIVAKDMALSQRVLTMANSAYCGHAKLSSLARAVVLLGLEQVRMCVTSALLQDQFERGSDDLRRAMLKSFHSAVLAKATARGWGVDSAADAFTCAMFHDLGRSLTIHYLHEEFAAICDRAGRRHGDELTESRRVLGIPYHELGAGVGARWRFAQSILAAMRPLPRGALPAAADEGERLALCAAYANAVSGALMDHPDPAEREAALADLARRVAPVFAPPAGALEPALAEAAALTARYARLIGLAPDRDEVVRVLTEAPAPAETPSAGRP